MVGNTAFVGENLKKGLEELGMNVTLIKEKELRWFKNKRIDNHFDIVHIHSPNFKKFLYIKKFVIQNLLKGKPKIIIHNHGSDLRLKYKMFPCYTFMFFIGDYFLYSTIDLAWWLRTIIKDDDKEYFICPVDTDVFKPINKCREGILMWGKKYSKGRNIPHDEIPDMLNKYAEVSCYPSYGLSPYLVSVSALEAGSCGCKVTHHPYMDRKWIMDNASIVVQCKKLYNIYNRVVGVKT